MIINTTQNYMREMAAEWISSDEKCVIELGCSDGNFTELLHRKKIKNYIGIDILKDKIDIAKKKFPDMYFICCNICESLHLLGEATTFVSFQCLEHLGTKNGIEDSEVLKSVKSGTHVVISVPNSPYKKEHKRWFEVDGWIKRYNKILHFDDIITIQNEKKLLKRSFLFNCRRI